jgi:hypothetical protein
MYYGIHFLSFDKIAVVKSTGKMRAKLENPAIYLGPSEDHKGNTSIFWNPKTKHII